MRNVSIDLIVGSVIAIVVAVSMIPVLNQSIANANLTGTQGTLGNLIPVVFIAGILLVGVYAFMKK